MMPAEYIKHEIRMSELLAGIDCELPKKDPVITGLSMDSRLVKKGDLFFALQGETSHGIQYLTDVIKSGVAAVLVDATAKANLVNITTNIPIVVIEYLPDLIGDIAKRFYADPSAELNVIAITGTNGKTSCATYLAQILSTEFPCGLIGTAGNGIYPELIAATHTTPNVITLNEELVEFVNQQVKSVVMEVSSHGIVQHRIDGIEFSVAVFTNISRDHLDYHGSMENYYAAKEKLFIEHTPKTSVINIDCNYGKKLADKLRTSNKSRFYTYGVSEFNSYNHIQISAINMTVAGMTFNIKIHGETHHVSSPLLGSFNVENITAVIAILIGLGWSFTKILPLIQQLQPAAGRMQTFQTTTGATVVVDYAHTPDALEKALKSLRKLTSTKLICVFGCGGNRDIGKRPQMGTIAEDIADTLILTNDNPRNERPELIIMDILMGVINKEKVEIILDRHSAIERAINLASEGDIVLVAGKGHENYQIIANKKSEFSDINVVRSLTKEG